MGSRLLSVVMSAVLAATMLLGISATRPADVRAGVQAPFRCPSAGAWDLWGNLFSSDDIKDDQNVISRTPPVVDASQRALLTGSLRLSVSVPAPGVRANDDKNHYNSIPGRFDVVLLSGPGHAKNFSLGADGSYSWEPVDGYFGGDSFVYTYVSGGQCVADSATVTIPGTSGARLRDDAYGAYNDRVKRSPSGCSASGCGVFVNDITPNAINAVYRDPFGPFVEGGAVSLGFASSGTVSLAHGTLVINRDGTFSYTPVAGYIGEDSFYYLASPAFSDHPDAFGNDWAKVTFTVTNPPPVTYPVGGDDTFSTDEDVPLTMTKAQLLANDANGSSIFRIVTPPASGHLNATACLAGCFFTGEISSLQYTPDADYHGHDWFSYEVGNANGTAFAYVDLTINDLYDPPQAIDDTFTVQAHTTVRLPVLDNDHDPEGVLDPSTVAFTTPPGGNHGTLTRPGDGTLEYTPDGSVTQIQRDYTVRGANNAITSAVFTVNITPNAAVDDAYAATEDTPLTVPAPGVLANDDPGDAPVITSLPAYGSLVFGPTGGFVYSPYPNSNGVDQFTYTRDGDPATVTITVAPVNDAPVVTLNSSCVSTPETPCSGTPDNRGDLDEGDTGHLRGYITDAERNGGTLTVDWGDGSTTTQPYPCAPDAATCGYTTGPETWDPSGVLCQIAACPPKLFFDLTHRYANNPPPGVAEFPITVTATEPGANGPSGQATERAVVHDLPPALSIRPECSLASCPGGRSILHQVIGGSVLVTAVVTDPGDDTGTLHIAWGDGTSDDRPLTCANGACGTISVEHTYPDAYGSITEYAVHVAALTDPDPQNPGTGGQSASTDLLMTVDTLADTDGPVANPSLDPEPNANGWNRAPVTVTWNWVDAGSGVDTANCTASSTATDDGESELNATCADIAGNPGAASQVVKVDTIAPAAAPTVSADANGAGWNDEHVTVTWNWSDDGSGIDDSSCTKTSTTTAQGPTTLQATCRDLAGNETTASRELKVDTGAPTVAPTVSPNPVLLTGTAAVSAGASDSVSGIATSSCGSVATTTLGSFQVSCTATDKAGNSASGSTSYVVGVAVANLNPPARSKYRVGMNVPVKFQLRQAGAKTIPAALATQLSSACAATVQIGTAAATCAVYDPKADAFKATVRVPSVPVGTLVPITVTVTASQVVVGTGATSILVSK